MDYLPKTIMKMYFLYALAAILFASCQTKNVTETERFDASVGLDGALNVYNNFLFEKPTRQTEDMVWRNVIVSKKNQRIICIDRYLSEGRTKGFVYVLQSETKRFPTLGLYHWDVSDSHNIEMAGGTLEHLRKLTLKRMKGDGRRD